MAISKCVCIPKAVSQDPRVYVPIDGTNGQPVVVEQRGHFGDAVQDHLQVQNASTIIRILHGCAIICRQQDSKCYYV